MKTQTPTTTLADADHAALLDAVRNLHRVRGRNHTEQALRRVFEVAGLPTQTAVDARCAVDRLQEERSELLRVLSHLTDALHMDPARPAAWARELFQASDLVVRLRMADRQNGSRDRRSGFDRRTEARPGADRRQTDRRKSDRRPSSSADLLDAYEQTTATAAHADINTLLEPR